MEERKYSVFEKLEEMKVKYYPKDMKACGQIILQAYIDEFKVRPEKEDRQIRHWRQVVNVYPQSFTRKMGELIKAYLKSPERREILNRPKQWELNRIKHKEDFEKAQIKKAARLLEEGQNKKKKKREKKPTIVSKPVQVTTNSLNAQLESKQEQNLEKKEKRVRRRFKITTVRISK